ncbi:hypothetical protein QQF64_017931 [Cirrhinus molitorella]|uniref:Uncharacterized protein n=1 Tax=Cirrhinus molitorella TaxID=172907 RepID=A0ABR3LK36_9TELE
MISTGVMCYQETVLTAKKILFLGNLNLSFWAGFFQKTIGCPCRRKRNAGFFLLRLARLDLQMFRASAHPKSSQASSLRSLIPAENVSTSFRFECVFRTN